MKVITTNLLNRFWKNGVKPIKEAVSGKLDASKVVNSLLATEEGFALDATQGKILKEQVDELNRKLQADDDWSTYSDNGWTLRYRHITANLISVEISKTSTGNNVAVAGNLIMAGIPFNVAFSQSVQCVMDVSGSIVGNGRAMFADNNGLYLYTPAYGNSVTYKAFGIVAVK